MGLEARATTVNPRIMPAGIGDFFTYITPDSPYTRLASGRSPAIAIRDLSFRGVDKVDNKLCWVLVLWIWLWLFDPVLIHRQSFFADIGGITFARIKKLLPAVRRAVLINQFWLTLRHAIWSMGSGVWHTWWYTGTRVVCLLLIPFDRSTWYTDILSPCSARAC